MEGFISFFVVLLAAVFFSALFTRLHLPWVISLLVAGIAIGPSGLDIFETDTTIEFLSQIGLIFLMFMAGLETRVSNIRRDLRTLSVVLLAVATIPFAIGGLVGVLFDYSTAASLLLGALFMSSSVAVVVPSLEANKVFHTRIGRVIVETTIVSDIISLIIVSVVLQSATNTGSLTTWLLYPLIAALLLVFRYFIPRIHRLFAAGSDSSASLFQQELRVVFVLLIGIVAVFELLGLHTILAGFLAGILLSTVITSRLLKEKLRAISYGVFIPFFFVVVGAQTNLGVFQQSPEALWFIVTVFGCYFLAKVISGLIGGMVAGFSKQQSALISASILPSLTTTLAAAFTAHEAGIIDQTIVGPVIILSIISTLLSPLIIALFGKKAAQLSVLKSSHRPLSKGHTV